MSSAIWHKEQNELLTEDSFDNGDLLLHLFPPKGITNNGQLVGAIVPGWFFTGYTKKQPGFMTYLEENFPHLNEYVEKMNDSDNPYLVFYKIL